MGSGLFDKAEPKHHRFPNVRIGRSQHQFRKSQDTFWSPPCPAPAITVHSDPANALVRGNGGQERQVRFGGRGLKHGEQAGRPAAFIEGRAGIYDHGKEGVDGLACRLRQLGSGGDRVDSP